MTEPALPSDLESALAALAAEREARRSVEAERDAAMQARDAAVAETARVQAKLTDTEAQIAHLELRIAKLNRQLMGQRSERSRRLSDEIEQLQLQLEDLAAKAGEDESAALAAAPAPVGPFTRRRPARRPWPEEIQRERVVLPGPTACPCCGGSRLAKLGEDVTETLEVIPRQYKVVQTVREKFTCRDCETITQPPAPFHATPRGFIGPSLLAMIVCDKFSLHLPLHRQSVRFQCEGIDLATTTLADQVGHAAHLLGPLGELITRHVFAAERLHGDDTTIRILAKDKCVTGRIWAYVRDDRPFGGPEPPAAVYYASADRRGAHPQGHLAGYAGILQADCYAGFGPLFDPKRKVIPITPAFCLAHARRNFFELADIEKTARERGKGKPVSPLALEAVRRLDAIFDIERQILGRSAAERLAVRQVESKPLFDDLLAWLTAERSTLSRSSELHQPINYVLSRWASFARFLDDGRICVSNNAAERAVKCVAIGRRNWTFAGSLRGAERAAAMLTLITTARLNDVDPHAWLADVLARISDLPVSRLHELLPWEWKRLREGEASAVQQPVGA